MYTIGIDVGGMSIKVGLVDSDGVILEKNAVKTEQDPNLAVENMVKQIEQLLSNNGITAYDIDGIGIGCPGTVSNETGTVDVLSNLNKWTKYPIASNLKKYYDKPIVISNDANVATLAEVKYGVAKGFNNCVMLTMGTGVGGGIVINKKLYEGMDSKGAELGHVTLVMNGLPCSCGRNGCIERYVSATALMNQTKEAMLNDKNSLMWECVDGDINKVNGKIPFDCAKKGDKSAITVVDNYVAYLSESMMNYMNIFRPDVFILGGGVSNQGDYLVERVKGYCEKFDYGYPLAPRPEIKIAKFGNDAGIIGAAALLHQD